LPTRLIQIPPVRTGNRQIAKDNLPASMPDYSPFHLHIME
jgi:hypothetical protein